MPVEQYGPDAWVIVHPGFNRNPGDYDYLPFQMSYEFATFLKLWDMGDYGQTEFHTRNYRIAQRKSCFPQVLLNGLGVFTTEGEKVTGRAKLYISQIIRHYEGLGYGRSEVPTWEQCHQMDQIVLAAVLQTKHIAFLKNLYNQNFPENGTLTSFGSRMPDDVQFEYKSYNGKLYMMTSALRPYPRRRKDFEVMVKLGLIGLDLLPKPYEMHGRGRAPVGAFLTEMGKRFFEDFQVRYDPQVKKQIELQRMMQE